MIHFACGHDDIIAQASGRVFKQPYSAMYCLSLLYCPKKEI